MAGSEPIRARRPLTYEARGWLFEWAGGPYIDVRRPGTVSSPSFGHEGYRVPAPPVDAINVWDYATDAPTISTPQELADRAEQWLDALAADWERQGY